MYFFMRVFILLFASLFLLEACKKKEETENPPQSFWATTVINNKTLEFSGYNYFLVDKGNVLQNNIIFLTNTKEKVHIIFEGTEAQTYKVIPGNPSCQIYYFDLSDRKFTADSGSVDISELVYEKKLGKYIVSGTFAFNSNFKVDYANPPYSIYAYGRNGAFSNIRNN